MEQSKLDIVYSSVLEPAMYRRHMRTLRQRNWRRLVLAGIAAGTIGFIAFLFLYGMWFATSASSGINRGLFYTFLFAIFLGIILVWQTAVTSVDQEIKRIPAGSVNTCRLSDEAFEVTHAAGVTVRIPWSIITLEQETDQAFHILYAQQRLAVFKKPLIEANAEDEFRSRIQAAKR